MIDTMNHGRVSQALLIYKTATRRFIADVLKRENGGIGDWFGDLVLTSLKGEKAERLKDKASEAAEEGSTKIRGGGEDEGPEKFLEETHFPHIVKENWKTFRHRLKDHDEVLRNLRQLKNDRDRVVHENGQPLSDEEAHEIIETCRSVVERFDSSAAKQLTELLNPPEPEGDSTDSLSADSPGCGEEESVWKGVKQFEREQERRRVRLDKLIRQFEQVGEEQHQIDELKTRLEARSIDSDLDDAWEELQSLRWLEIAPELITAAFGQMYGGFGIEGTEDGWKMDFSARSGSEEVYLQIAISVE